jgi:hypothetical protein
MSEGTNDIPKQVAMATVRVNRQMNLVEVNYETQQVEIQRAECEVKNRTRSSLRIYLNWTQAMTRGIYASWLSPCFASQTLYTGKTALRIGRITNARWFTGPRHYHVQPLNEQRHTIQSGKMLFQVIL